LLHVDKAAFLQEAEVGALRGIGVNTFHDVLVNHQLQVDGPALFEAPVLLRAGLDVRGQIGLPQQVIPLTYHPELTATNGLLVSRAGWCQLTLDLEVSRNVLEEAQTLVLAKFPAAWAPCVKVLTRCVHTYCEVTISPTGEISLCEDQRAYWMREGLPDNMKTDPTMQIYVHVTFIRDPSPTAADTASHADAAPPPADPPVTTPPTLPSSAAPSADDESTRSARTTSLASTANIP